MLLVLRIQKIICSSAFYMRLKGNKTRFLVILDLFSAIGRCVHVPGPSSWKPKGADTILKEVECLFVYMIILCSAKFSRFMIPFMGFI